MTSTATQPLPYNVPADDFPIWAVPGDLDLTRGDFLPSDSVLDGMGESFTPAPEACPVPLILDGYGDSDWNAYMEVMYVDPWERTD